MNEPKTEVRVDGNAVRIETAGAKPIEATSKLESITESTGPPKEVTNSIGMKLVLIPSGEFIMGSPDSDKEAQADEKPQHPVRITRPFYLGATEVTVGQFRRVVDAKGFRTEAETEWQGGLGLERGETRVRARSEVHLAQPRLRPDGRAPRGQRELERRDRVLQHAE